MSLVLSVCVLALGLAGWLAQWVAARPTGTAAMRAVSETLRAEGSPFEWRARGIATFVLAMGVLSLHGITRPQPHASMAVLSVFALVLGAVLETASARISAWISEKANVRAAAGARVSDDAAMQVALRTGCVSSVVVTASSLLGFAVLFSIACFVRAIPPDAAPRVLAPFALGAAASSMASGERRTTSSLFVVTAIESVGTTMLAGVFVTANEATLVARGIEPIAIVTLPLLIRAFGIVASTIGAMSIAVGEEDEPIAALHRGLQVAAPLALLGAGASVFWSMRGVWLPFAVGAASCVLCGYALLLAIQYATHADYSPTRSLSEPSEPSDAIARTISVGLRGAAIPILLVTIAIFVSHASAELTGLAGAGALGVAIGASSVLSLSGFVLTLDSVSTTTRDARRVIAESVAADEAHVVVRVDRANDAGRTARAISRGFSIAMVPFVAYAIVANLLARVRVLGAAPVASVALLLGALLVVTFAAFAFKGEGSYATTPTAVLAPFAIGGLFRIGAHGRGVEGVAALVLSTTAFAASFALVLEVATAASENAGRERHSQFSAVASTLVDFALLLLTAALVSGPFLTS